MFPATRGAGRFAKIGLPEPELLGSLVGGVEVLCGVLVLLGLLTGLAAVPLIVIMLVALYTTKLVILREQGFWEMLHSSRTDWSMLLGSSFLCYYGAGAWSVDHYYSPLPPKRNFG
nr:DoxX family membrane protein [Eisenibacter elegans]